MKIICMHKLTIPRHITNTKNPSQSRKWRKLILCVIHDPKFGSVSRILVVMLCVVDTRTNLSFGSATDSFNCSLACCTFSFSSSMPACAGKTQFSRAFRRISIIKTRATVVRPREIVVATSYESLMRKAKHMRKACSINRRATKPYATSSTVFGRLQL